MNGALPGHTQVLIAGGGPVGLAAAVELGRRGIECVVIEPRATVSHARPRCKTISIRSMEHLRRWGIADRLRERAPLPVAWSQDIVFCTSLVGYELSRFSGVLGLTPEDGRSAETGQQAPQYVLEELLRDVAGESPSVTLATGRRVTGLEQDDDAVRVAVTDEGGNRSVISAVYVLGCDGPHSAVRAAIGADYVGEHALRPNFGMVFHAPELLRRTAHGPAVQYWILNRAAPSLMGPIDRTARGGSSPSGSTARRASATRAADHRRLGRNAGRRDRAVAPIPGRHGCSLSTAPATAGCSSPGTPPTSIRRSAGTG